MKEDYKEIHKMCNICEKAKSSSCNFPCNDYTDYMYNQSLKNNIGESESNNDNDDNDGNDIENFLEYDVSDNIWLKIINKEIPIIEMLDENSIYNYLETENTRYCKQEGICPECRGNIVLKVEYEEIWGSKRESERYLVCENGC